MTEYIARDLRQLLQEDREKLTPLELVSISSGIARGLAYLEEQKVVHRDIALRNILVGIKDNLF